MDNNDTLIHYGIPRRSGRFKFGSGKDPYQNVSTSKSNKAEKPLSVKDSVKAHNKKVSELSKQMTDAELTAAINRRRLEDTYKQLNSVPIPESKVKKIMQKAAVTALETVATNAAKSLLQAWVNKITVKTLNVKISDLDKDKKK